MINSHLLHGHNGTRFTRSSIVRLRPKTKHYAFDMAKEKKGLVHQYRTKIVELIRKSNESEILRSVQIQPAAVRIARWRMGSRIIHYGFKSVQKFDECSSSLSRCKQQLVLWNSAFWTPVDVILSRWDTFHMVRHIKVWTKGEQGEFQMVKHERVVPCDIHRLNVSIWMWVKTRAFSHFSCDFEPFSHIRWLTWYIRYWNAMQSAINTIWLRLQLIMLFCA